VHQSRQDRVHGVTELGGDQPEQLVDRAQLLEGRRAGSRAESYRRRGRARQGTVAAGQLLWVLAASAARTLLFAPITTRLYRKRG
jgi:hypothetical protein